MYAFTENFVLPLSHDEVVHGKGSLLAACPATAGSASPTCGRTTASCTATPGKKLLFMGSEFAQARDWNCESSLDWHLVADPMHLGVQRLVHDLNHLYRESPALYEQDCVPQGFEWIDHHDAQRSVLSFIRKGKRDRSVMVVISNFTPRFTMATGSACRGPAATSNA